MYIFIWSDVLWGNISKVVEKCIVESNNELFTKKFLRRYLIGTGLNPIEYVVFNSVSKEDFLDSRFEVIYTDSGFEIIPPVSSITQAKNLMIFYHTLKEVRKALANIPVYMMFDDHDVTDDWNLNENWAVRVASSRIGSDLINQGLKAYKLCQHWGNMPNAFSNLVEAHKLKTFSYTKKFPSFNILALDLRTDRGWGEGGVSYAELLSTEAMKSQIPESLTEEFIFVISGTPVIGVPKVESIQSKIGSVHKKFGRYDVDAEAWGLNEHSYNLLLSKLGVLGRNGGGKIIFLSGDVHYAFAASLQLTSAVGLYKEEPTEQVSTNVLFVQLCSSSLKNYEPGTLKLKYLHDGGYGFLPVSMRHLESRQNVPFILEKEKRFGYFPSPITMTFGDLGIDHAGGAFNSQEKPSVDGIEELHAGNIIFADRAVSDWSTLIRYYIEKHGCPGKEIVGHNNISQIKIKGDSGDKSIQQITHWVIGRVIMPSDTVKEMVVPVDKTTFTIPLK